MPDPASVRAALTARLRALARTTAGTDPPEAEVLLLLDAAAALDALALEVVRCYAALDGLTTRLALPPVPRATLAEIHQMQTRLAVLEQALCGPDGR